MARSVCAVLVAQACNIGYRPVARRNDPSLTPARLEWDVANFFRPETLTAANNRLIAYHRQSTSPGAGAAARRPSAHE